MLIREVGPVELEPLGWAAAAEDQSYCRRGRGCFQHRDWKGRGGRGGGGGGREKGARRHGDSVPAGEMQDCTDSNCDLSRPGELSRGRLLPPPATQAAAQPADWESAAAGVLLRQWHPSPTRAHLAGWDVLYNVILVI